MKNKFVDFKVLATSLCCSVVMGLISFAFLKCLDYAADFRSFFPLCYMFLPVAGSSLSADRTAEKMGYAGKYKCQRCKSLWHFFTVICTLNNNVVAH